MKKLSFVVRWSAAFMVLGTFSFISVTNLLTSSTSALAKNYQGLSGKMAGKEKYLTINTGSELNKLQKTETVCALTQSQFNSAKSLYGATAKSLTVEGKNITFAVIDKSNGNGPGSVIKGLNLSPSDCKVMNVNKSFYINLVPGVS